MPIKWSAVEVSEAADKIEAEINKAVPFLEQARVIASQARGISNLPQYIDQSLHRLHWVIDAAIGDGHHEGSGSFRSCVVRMRESIPEGALEAEHQATKHGKTGNLF